MRPKGNGTLAYEPARRAGYVNRWAQFVTIKVGVEALCGLKIVLETSLGDY